MGLVLGPVLSLHAAQVSADWSFELGGETVQIDLRNTASLGAAWRAQNPDPSLIGKLSLPENRELCVADDCIGLSRGDTEPNERFLAAPGALSSNTDDGNLNYDRGDLIAATAKLSSRVRLDWGRYYLNLSALYFFDPVNNDFDERHPNRIIAPGRQPGVSTTTERPREVRRDIGRDFQLRDANIGMELPLGERGFVNLSVGRQLLNWGVSAFAIQGSLNIVNSPDVNNLARPGGELFELYRPQGMAVADGNLGGPWSFQAFYQYEWQPYGLPARGSFLSFFDAGNDVRPDEYVNLPFAKTPEDPHQLQSPSSPLLGLVSDTSFSIRRQANREPRGGGQYGLALYYFADELGKSGTEFGFYAANYHSRIPIASGVAAQASCARREGNNNNRDTANLLQFLSDCGIPILQTPGQDFEALPLDTAGYFLEYPEDIRMFGVSFSGAVGNFILEGELSYRPNQPVQVDLEDVIFAALQPAFPRNEIVIIADPLRPVTDLLSLLPDLGIPGLPIEPNQLKPATLTDSRTAIPDFLTAYRGGVPGEVAPGEYIRGYERMKQWQATLGTLYLRGPDVIPGSTQSGFLLEATAVFLPDLPPLSQMQFEGPGTHTHASPGIADTGNGLLINPAQNTDGYVTRTSWGYRAGLLAVFQDVVVPGLQLRPLIVWVHDIKGVSPGFAENFLEGRHIMLNNLEAKYRGFSFNLQYARFGGAGKRNTLRDRDLVALAISYDF